MTDTLFVAHRSLSQRDVPVLTWSVSARRALEHLSRLDLPVAVDVWVDGAQPYGLSASLGGEKSPLGEDRLVQWAFELVVLSRAHPCVLFAHLLDDSFSFDSLRHLLVAIREVLVRHLGDPRAAMVPAISSATAAESEFPLHCDLYAADRLWNIFNRGAVDGSGAALLLPLDRVNTLLADAGAPKWVRVEVAARVLRKHGSSDAFDRLMWLLYAKQHSWSRGFAVSAKRHSIRVAAEAGVGYLINDARVMHGRERSSGDVEEDRLVRLVFAADASGFADAPPRDSVTAGAAPTVTPWAKSACRGSAVSAKARVTSALG